jgi:hypothetical protein
MVTVEKISIALPPEMTALVREAVGELRALWQQALDDPRPGMAAEAVLDRLEHKYQAMVDGTAPAR